ncbi:hypothetical protein GCK32_020841 [Trichostrongylus colubriformis]|uniref:Uncharacterized protein n=1 Tax=Trichostrongylus colubriformis TaxID=6319 RepID=A0AAN8FQV3_TRICO
MSLLLVGDLVLPTRRRHTLNLALLKQPLKGREVVAYAAADQHPELRSPIRMSDDDETEFVRREWTETVYKKVRTYKLKLSKTFKYLSCGITLVVVAIRDGIWEELMMLINAFNDVRGTI